MDKALAAQILCVATLITSSCVLSKATGSEPQHPFPMAKGASWTYQGLVRFTHHINRVGEAKVTWRTEVKRFIQHGDVRAAVISGLPSDLDWSNGIAQHSDSLLVESKGNFYRVSDEHLEELLRHLERPSDDLAGMLRDDDIFLKWPLRQGEKFCDAEGMERPDTYYCWFVESASLFQPLRIDGVPPGRRNAFVVTYRTNPDHIRFTFVPGIGITAYEYRHHGTVADTELKLIEFQNPSADGK
jgi:hypothetical protein